MAPERLSSAHVDKLSKMRVNLFLKLPDIEEHHSHTRNRRVGGSVTGRVCVCVCAIIKTDPAVRRACAHLLRIEQTLKELKYFWLPLPLAGKHKTLSHRLQQVGVEFGNPPDRFSPAAPSSLVLSTRELENERRVNTNL